MLKYIDLIKLTFDNKYSLTILYTILVILLGKVLIYILKKQLIKINNNKLQYKIINFIKIIINTVEMIIIYLLWENNIKNVITLISFISAALTLSLKDLIFNLIAGIYIKVNKPFNIEDRIEINNFKGDVIGINTHSFELLEVKDEYDNQSSGVILIIPNSTIFTNTLKNYSKGFKYIWNEINIILPIDSNINDSKKIIYKIVNNIDLIKNIPTKMKNELKKNTTYRMYYNKYEPVIYTKVKDKHIELSLRYLVNPKKARIVESYIWNEILKENKNGNIDLLKNKNS